MTTIVAAVQIGMTILPVNECYAILHDKVTALLQNCNKIWKKSSNFAHKKGGPKAAFPKKSRSRKIRS
jgi:hypothetical protein